MVSKKRTFKLICIAALIAAACSHYSKKASEAREALRSNNPDQAAKLLEEDANKQNDDQLVYILDYAQALQQGGRFDESNKAFLKAVDISKIQDYTSLSREAGSLLLNEGMVQYKGENYEKILIHVQLALNFLMMGNQEEALVEVRAIDLMLDKFKNEAKREYEQNTFSRYLSAMIWEADRKWDDALIAYKKVHQQNATISFLGSDLIRSAQVGQFPEDLKKFKAEYKDQKIDPWWNNKNMGELVLLYQQGVAPVKRPDPASPRMPRLYRVYSDTQRALLEVIDGPSVQSEIIYDVSDAAIKTLDEDYGRLVAKRVGGVVTKAIVADQIRQKNEALGFLAWVGMNLADQADLRQWSTLPSSYQVARIPLKAGKYKFKLTGLNATGNPTPDLKLETEVEIRGRKKVFVMWRTY